MLQVPVENQVYDARPRRRLKHAEEEAQRKDGLCVAGLIREEGEQAPDDLTHGEEERGADAGLDQLRGHDEDGVADGEVGGELDELVAEEGEVFFHARDVGCGCGRLIHVLRCVGLEIEMGVNVVCYLE